MRDRLHAAPDGPVAVLHAGERAIFLDVGGWCVGVVGPGAAQVPCALRVTGMGSTGRGPTGRVPTDMRTIGIPDPRGRLSAYLVRGELHVGGIPLPITRLVGAYVPPLGDGATRMTSPVTVQATPPVTVAGFVSSAVPDGHLDATTATGLLGRGDGLTPLGDDILTGWLAMHRAARVATPDVDAVVDEARDRTTLLSATLLDCARHGEVLPQYAAWVRGLGTPAEPAAVRALHAVGASSGAGLHAGGLLALDQLRDAA